MENWIEKDRRESFPLSCEVFSFSIINREIKRRHHIDYQGVWRSISQFLKQFNLSSCTNIIIFPGSFVWSNVRGVQFVIEFSALSQLTISLLLLCETTKILKYKEQTAGFSCDGGAQVRIFNRVSVGFLIAVLDSSWIQLFSSTANVECLIRWRCLSSWSCFILFACYRTCITIRCCIGTIRTIYTFAILYVILSWCFLVPLDKCLDYELDGDFINALNVVGISIT